MTSKSKFNVYFSCTFRRLASTQ